MGSASAARSAYPTAVTTAAAALRAGDVDWHQVFAVEGARWFHTGGVFAALSDSTPGVVAEAIDAARAAGTTVSYDLNYRPSLWKAQGGLEAARAVNRTLAAKVDVLIGNEEDFTACLRLDVAGVDERLTGLDPTAFEAMIEAATSQFPNLRVVATTLREVHSATRNDWGAVGWSAESGFVRATPRRDLESSTASAAATASSPDSPTRCSRGWSCRMRSSGAPRTAPSR